MISIMVLRIPNEPIATAFRVIGHGKPKDWGSPVKSSCSAPIRRCGPTSRFLIEDPAAFIKALRQSTLTSGSVDKIEKLGTTVLTVPGNREVAAAALQGETGLKRIIDYRGIPVIEAYGPVDLDSVRWAVIAKIDEAEAMAPLRDYAIRVLAWGVGLSLLATMLALGAAHELTRPITALVRAARQVSQGTLDVEVEVNAQDEYREFGDGLQRNGDRIFAPAGRSCSIR